MTIEKQRGFTLIELLAIIIILGIIALIAIPTVNEIVMESKKNEFESVLNTIENEIGNKCENEKIKKKDITKHYRITNGKIDSNIKLNVDLPDGDIYIDNACNLTYELSNRIFIGSKRNPEIRASINSLPIPIEGSPNTLANKIRKSNPVINVPATRPGIDNSLETENSLITELDDYGVTFYFRGNVTNNYVEFGVHPQSIWYDSYFNYYDSSKKCGSNCNEIKKGTPMIFRIVRINGDGTIRLVLQPSITNMKFNKEIHSEKYVGYTYNRDTNEADSDVKTYLDNWYKKVKENNKGIDDVIAVGKFCSDTSVSSEDEGIITYSSYTKNFPNKLNWDNGNRNIFPSFKCPPTTKNYGGLYELKVGLLSLDELSFSGIKYYDANRPSLFNYLDNGSHNWTMTPLEYSRKGFYSIGTGSKNTTTSYGNFKGGVRPVINIKSNTIVDSGNGKKDSPYKINLKSEK